MFGRIVDIEVKPYEPPPGVGDLADLFTAVRQRPYAMLLLSGGDLDCAGYSLMGWDPFLVVRAKGRRVEVRQGGDTRVCRGRPLRRAGGPPGGPGVARGLPAHAHGRRRVGISGL